MGIIQEVLGPAAEQFSQLPLSTQATAGVGCFLVVTVILNVLSQVLFRNPNEPPVVFHWFPFIGSTIKYGLDPPRFFKEMQKKVSISCMSSRDAAAIFLGMNYIISFLRSLLSTATSLTPQLAICPSVRRHFHVHSPREKNHRLCWDCRQRFHLERQIARCVSRGHLHRSHHACFRQRCRV